MRKPLAGRLVRTENAVRPVGCVARDQHKGVCQMVERGTQLVGDLTDQKAQPNGSRFGYSQRDHHCLAVGLNLPLECDGVGVQVLVQLVVELEEQFKGSGKFRAGAVSLRHSLIIARIQSWLAFPR
ncbi:MAG: hypothetical protein ABI873_09330 [Marmoricola sp.]